MTVFESAAETETQVSQVSAMYRPKTTSQFSRTPTNETQLTLTLSCRLLPTIRTQIHLANQFFRCIERAQL